MFGFKDISVEFLTSNPWPVSAAMLLLVLVTVWLYRDTNPPIRGYLKFILTALRLMAVIALTLVLLEPVVSFSLESNRQPRLALLIDESASMDRVEFGLGRGERIDSLLESADFDRLDDLAEIELFPFSDRLHQEGVELNRDRTALGDVLEELNRQSLNRPADKWLLLSDGSSNFGRAPASLLSSLKRPIIAVDAVLEPVQFDIGIDRVDHNQVLFALQSAAVGVKLKWRHATGKQVTVRLMDGQRLLTEKKITIDQETGFGDYELRFTPTRPGLKVLTVKVTAGDDGEAANNSKSFSVKVLKSKLAILLVSLKPDYELSFLKRYLERSDKYEVDLRVINRQGGNLRDQFPTRQADLNRFDLVVFHDLPSRTLAGSQELIRSYLADRGGAIWVQMGEEFNSDGPVASLNQLLPFYQSQPALIQYREFHGEPVESQLYHPVNHLASSRAAIREAWASAPPFQLLVYCDVIAPDATVLVTAQAERLILGRAPILGFKRVGPGKVFASAAAPFWHWGFLSEGYGDDSGLYELLLEGAISWLTIPDDHDPVRVNPSKDIFSRGEVVVFEAYAYDLGYRPIEGVTGLVELVHDSTGDRFEADLVQSAEGVYTVRFGGLPTGDYKYTGRVEKEDRLLKEDQGLIKVERFSMEEFDQGGKSALLKQLALATGGEYVRIDDFKSLANSLELAEINELTVGEASLWNNYWLMIVFLAALAIEWIVRKFNHLL